MSKKNISSETKKLLNYIKTNLVKEYPTNKISLDYFILAVLDNEDCVAYKAIEKTTISQNLELLKTLFINIISKKITPLLDGVEALFDKSYDEYIDLISNNTDKPINSALLLIQILKRTKNYVQQFKEVGISLEQIVEAYNNISSPNKPQSEENKIIPIITQSSMNNISMMNTNKIFINVMDKIIETPLDNAIVSEDFYDLLFTYLNRQNKNNVIFVGKHGVGKTTLALNIGNLILENKEPIIMQNRAIYLIDVKTILKCGYFKNLMIKIDDFLKSKYRQILIIDDVHLLLNEKYKMFEYDVIQFLYNIIQAPNISVILTTTPNEYDNVIGKNPLFNNDVERIDIEEPNEEDTLKIIKRYTNQIFEEQNIYFSDDVINCINKLSLFYIKNKTRVTSIIEIINTCASYIQIQAKDSQELINKRMDLCETDYELAQLTLAPSNDEIEKQIAQLQKTKKNIIKDIKLIEKQEKLAHSNIIVTKDIVYKIFNLKYNIPIEMITTSDSEDSFALLRTLDTNLKKVVVGQDDAIDIITKVIKKRKIGLSDINKPSVFMFIGSTGIGKTYLSKQIAKQLFGDEKKFIKLDMSEYSDSISVNKLIGTSPGYIGYDNKGILISKIQESGEYVILLDEIEKAHEKVHNLFLQLFDEGRLTDNEGETYDFSNCIIILTSNVGAKERSETPMNLGFTNNPYNKEADVTYKALKRTFKPEFINRINHIIYFNDLTKDNLKQIVKLEINKIVQRIKSIDYNVDETITDTLLPEFIINSDDIDLKMGARSIIRCVQKNLEDKVADYIITYNPPKQYTFKFSDLNTM